MTIVKSKASLRANLIKLVLLPLLLSVCTSANADCEIDLGGNLPDGRGLVAVGDSITSVWGSWVDILHDCGWNTQKNAQGGRMAIQFGFSPDLRVTSQFSYLVYFLGTNDFSAEFKNRDSGNTDYFDAFKDMFIDHMTTAISQNYKPVVLIPADYPRLNDGVPGGREFMIEYCSEQSEFMVCINMEDHWDYDQTLADDQIHPTSVLQAVIAKVVHDELVTLPAPQESLPPGC